MKQLIYWQSSTTIVRTIHCKYVSIPTQRISSLSHATETVHFTKQYEKILLSTKTSISVSARSQTFFEIVAESRNPTVFLFLFFFNPQPPWPGVVVAVVLWGCFCCCYLFVCVYNEIKAYITMNASTNMQKTNPVNFSHSVPNPEIPPCFLLEWLSPEVMTATNTKKSGEKSGEKTASELFILIAESINQLFF